MTGTFFEMKKILIHVRNWILRVPGMVVNYMGSK
jgi:hypothetical protein